MLKLYHGANSVCSIKVRIVLDEKDIPWESHHIDLPKGQQFTPEFVAVNPRSFVPVLDHDGVILRESSVICEYIDQLSETNKLMPDAPADQAKTRIWGTQCLEYHDSVNTLTFASYQRAMLLAKPKDELAKRWASMPDQLRAAKMQDLVEKGAQSAYVPVALSRMARLAAEVNEDLAKSPWLMGEAYSLADAMLTSYFFRTECVGLAGLWETRYPRTTDWYNRIKKRRSFGASINPWLNEEEMAKILAAGQDTFLSSDKFANYL